MDSGFLFLFSRPKTIIAPKTSLSANISDLKGPLGPPSVKESRDSQDKNDTTLAYLVQTVSHKNIGQWFPFSHISPAQRYLHVQKKNRKKSRHHCSNIERGKVGEGFLLRCPEPFGWYCRYNKQNRRFSVLQSEEIERQRSYNVNKNKLKSTKTQLNIIDEWRGLRRKARNLKSEAVL